MADVNDLAEPLRSIVAKILAESGGKVTIVSGRRSRAEQEVLYAKYLSGNGNLAAKPGTSQHETGNAVDFGGDLNLAAQLGAKYGLFATVPGEPWHFSAGDGMTTPDGMDDFAMDLDGSANPEDVLANRLHSVLRIIGLDPTVGSPGADSPSWDDPDMDEQFAPGAREAVGGAFNMAAQYGGSMASGAKGQLQKYAQKMLAKMGWSESEMGSLITLWDKESGWDPTAQNPDSTAYGIAQFLNGTWAGTGQTKTADPYQQIDAGLRYIQARYGTPSKALQFHLRNNMY